MYPRHPGVEHNFPRDWMIEGGTERDAGKTGTVLQIKPLPASRGLGSRFRAQTDRRLYQCASSRYRLKVEDSPGGK